MPFLSFDNESCRLRGISRRAFHLLLRILVEYLCFIQSLLFVSRGFAREIVKSEFLEALLARIAPKELVRSVPPRGIRGQDPLGRFSRQILLDDFGGYAIFC